MATENVKVIKVDTAEAQTSVRDLRKELKELRDTMLSTEKGTEEYNQALKQSAEIQHVLKEQMEEINASAMDFGQIASNITKSIGGMVAGFQAAKAVMNLFGIENEEVVKSLQKMQNLMAISQALPAIDNALKAYKRLGLAIQATTASLSSMQKALVGTGIGAVIAGIGLLAANWDKVTEALYKWGVIHEDAKKKLDEQKAKVAELTTELQKLESNYAQWQKDNKIAALNSKAKKSYEDLSTAIKDYEMQLSIIGAKQQLPENQSRERWEALNDEGKALLESIRLLKLQQRAILDDAASYKELGKAAKDTSKELEVLLWDFTQKLEPKSLQEELLAKFADNPVKIPVKLEIDEDEEENTSFEDSFRKKIEATVQGLRTAFTTPEEQYQEELSALNTALNTKIISYQEYYKLVDALNKEQTQREIQRYALAANSIGSIFTSLGSLMEEGSEEQKAMQIMGATINMLGGITAAIAGAFTTHSGPWDIALAALQAASIAAGGAATIAQMTKTTKNNAAAMAGSNPSSAAISRITAPVQYTQDVQGSSIEGAIKNTKVYVTETDITNTQSKVRVSETEAYY